MGKAPNEATCIKLKATHLLLVVCTNDMPMTSKYLGMRSPNCLVRCTNRIISRCCSRKVHVSIDTLPSLNQGTVQTTHIAYQHQHGYIASDR